MSGDTINSDTSLQVFINKVKGLYQKHKYITYKEPAIGPDRSLDQNSLFHVWLTEYAAHLLCKDKREVTPGEVAGMKRATKGRYYAYSGADFMVHVVTDPKTGRQKKDYTSSKNWKRGQMYAVLEWLQMEGANDGVLLEAKGEYAKLKRQQAA
ncbi:hypothetical protein HBA55_29545 [Pseudomaricurvus alkylphenolicus]|uniref:hypothetical protein n=1 Tax=Pseudomaricurvus alkylphenolicus TaxID=1306991 RepID=UPI00141FE501|nr:hypothetical protein [Pseudomaricurvus alkylphenolicus]NIB43783.1 hypothetical protein [Pseudomaricurvus alkylphenolicus]